MSMIARNRLILSSNCKTIVNVLFRASANSFKNAPKVNAILYNERNRHSFISSVQQKPHPSKYYPLNSTDAMAETIISTLKNKTDMTDEEWEEFKADLIDNELAVSEENFSSIVMNALLTLNDLDLSRSFLKYVEKGNVKPNFLTYLKYISICSRNPKRVTQDHILKIISKVKDQIDSSPVLDNKRAEYIIQGLCATDQWRESFKYLPKVVSGKPTREMCNSLACAAIRNNDHILAWEILTKWINAYDTVSDSVIGAFIEVALEIQKISNRESDLLIVKLFSYMQRRDIIISIDVAKLIEQYFKSHRLKWNITHSKVSRYGKCETCEDHLKLFSLTNQEFDDLRKAFLERAVLKSDIYINTNTTEFRRYMEFINTYKPFHIVLDGLNAAYTFKGFISRKNLSMHLLRVVKVLSGKSRKLLVLGRKHMKTWYNIDKISRGAQLFFTENISQDDPFTIYATLASGPHTLFVSGDLMRDHIARLEDSRLIHLFKRWQLSHQMFVKTDDYNEISIVEPVRHSITIHGSMDKGWHIPFDDKILLDPYEELNNWLCIQKCIS